MANLLTTSEAASKLGITRQAVRWRIKNGRMRGIQVGTFWLVDSREVKRQNINRNRRNRRLKRSA